MDVSSPLTSAAVFEEDEEAGQVTTASYFSCQESSFLQNKLFGKCVTLSLEDPKQQNSTLSRKYFSVGTVLYFQIPSMFDGLKKNYCFIRSLTSNDNLDLQSTNALSRIESLRKEMSNAFLILFQSLQTFYYESTSHDRSLFENSEEHSRKLESINGLVTQVKSLLIHVDRIICIPNIVRVKAFDETSKVALYYYHYFHMLLDIWLNSALILRIVSLIPLDLKKKEIFCCDLAELEPSVQVISLIIADLICLALKQHEHVNAVSDYSPFKCKCIQEVWIMCIIMLEERSNDLFWTSYSRIIRALCKSSGEQRVIEKSIYSFQLFGIEIDCPDVIASSMWLTLHLSDLYKYDKWGYYEDSVVPKSGYIVVKYLMNLIMTSRETKEKTLKDALIYYFHMVLFWEPSSEVILPLTDYFIRKMNETFLPVSDINSLIFLQNNSSDWNKKIVMLTALDNSSNDLSSYDAYLKILCIFLSKDSDGNFWRSLRGRIYSKFLPKKLRESSEIALQNIFTLCLAIAHAGHEDVTKDIAVKICEFVSTIESASDVKKQMISWRAIFVLMLIYQKKKFSLGMIISKISKIFINACKNHQNAHNNAMKKNLFMKLILTYIDNMSDIFQHCQDLSSDEHELLNVDFSILLLSCAESDLNYILQAFSNILRKVKSSQINCVDNITEIQYVNFLTYFNTNVNPSIEKLLVSNTPPLVIAEISALCITLNHKFATSSDSPLYIYSSMFLNILSKDKISSKIVCCFLCSILEEDQLVNALKSNFDFITTVFQSWLKCIINVTPPFKQMDLLTSKILMQQEILDLFPKVSCLNFENSTYLSASFAFFRVMGNHFDELDSLQDKNNLKLKILQYFKMFVPTVVSRMKKQPDVPTLTYVYKIISNLIELSSQLLHTKFNSNSILPQLIDQTVFPQIVFPKDKTAQSLMTCSIKEYLPKILRGLLKLKYADDMCIQREIKCIIETYVGLYTLPNNPISKLYQECTLRKPDVLPLLLGILSKNVLSNKSGTKNGFLMCFELLKIATMQQRKEIVDVLLKCAFQVYLQHDGPYSDFLLKLVQEVFVCLKETCAGGEIKTVLTPAFEWLFLEKLKWCVARGFKILQVVVDRLPDFFLEIVPCLTQSIVKIEEARGSGCDYALRDSLQKLVNYHQEKYVRNSS